MFYRYQVIELRFSCAIDLLDVIEHQLKKKDDVSHANYTFSASIIPLKHANYYRLCDIKDDAMQQVIHSNDGKEKSTCNVSDVYTMSYIICIQFYRKNMNGVKLILIEN